MAKKRKTFGYDVHCNKGKGPLVATYRAYSALDVARALDMEWGAEAAEFKIERCPLALCYDSELSLDRHYDLTSNAGWASIVSAQEVGAMA